MSDFKDDDFDSFDDNNFDDFGSQKSLKEGMQNNPLLKIFLVVAVLIAVIAAIFIFGGKEDEEKSQVGRGLDKRETLGGEISQNYADVLETVNEQRREEALQTGESSIAMLVNPEETELLTPSEELPPYKDYDPLSSFRVANTPTTTPEPVTDQEPVLLAPEEIFPQQQPVLSPSPEAVQALAQAMAANVDSILNQHTPGSISTIQVSEKDYFEQQAAAKLEAQTQNLISSGQMVDSDGDGIPDTHMVVNGETGDVVIQTILIPAGTINYGQILIEANSDVPGPVLAQLVSGPLSGARLIGGFTVASDTLVLTFNTIVVDGISQTINAIAIEPTTTLPGVATEVDQRYFKRVLLPAAARFMEGVGAAIAQDSQTTVTVSGDTVIEESKSLDFKQELGAGVDEAFQEIADFMSDEADATPVLVRVARGTPVGIFFLEPVLEEQAQ